MVEKQNSKGKRILISIPRVMLEEMDVLAKKEFRTRSELIREMFRTYKAQAIAQEQARNPIIQLEPRPIGETDRYPGPFFDTDCEEA